MRVGMGIDAHSFEAGDRLLVLGGVQIPFEKALEGHSDADVVIHSLMDALLGACGEGDIGELFPDTEPEFEDISSMELLGRVMGIVDDKGYSISNLDITLVCERPRIAAYREEIRRSIAGACRLDIGAVSVKGTTTEGMGFTGRSEGIASFAVVLLE